MKNLSLILAVLILAFLGQNKAVAQSKTFLNKEWETSSGNVGSNYQRSASVVDASDNVYVTSNTINANGDTDVSLTKYDSEGALQWQQTYNGSGNGDDYGVQLVLDGSGNVYVVAALNTGTNNTDFGLLKYNGSGTLQWSSTWAGAAGGYDVPADLVLDGSGNIYVVGGSEVNTTFSDYAIVKFNSTGTFQWHTSYDYNSLHDAATSVAIQSSNIVVTGASASSAINWDYATLQLNPSTGSISNTTRTSVTGAGLDQALDVKTDYNNNIYITGYAEISSNKRIRTLKFNDTLGLEWSADVNGIYDDIGTSVDIDDNGNVYVAGSTELSNGDLNFITVKYDSSGTEQWKKEFGDGDEINTYGAEHVVVVNDTVIMVVGTIDNNGEIDFMAICYDETGGLVFTEEYDNNGADDEVSSITVDGDVFYMTGTSDNGTTRTTTVVKYDTWEKDQAIIYQNGDPFAFDDEILLRFNPSSLITATVNNKNKTWGIVSDFIDANTITAINTNLSYDIGKQNCYKLFPKLTTNDTVATSRSGNTVELPPFYATFGMLLPDNSNDSTERALLNGSAPHILATTNNCFASLLAGANDPRYSNGESPNLRQYAGNTDASINIEPAWNFETGSPAIVVGVYDTGINRGHEDLTVTNNGASSVIAGYDYINFQDIMLVSDPDFRGHGSAVTSLIASHRNNSIGIAGVAGGDGSGGVSIHDMKLFDSETPISCQQIHAPISDIITAIEDGATGNIGGQAQDIMNHSWETSRNQFLREVWITAYKLEVIMVAASGNAETQINIDFGNQCGNFNFPSCYRDHLGIRVGANNATGARAVFSDCGINLDVIAPGTYDLYTTIHQDGNAYADGNMTHGGNCSWPINGTSFGAPHVVGVAALMASYNLNNSLPNVFSPEDTEELIQMAATDITASPNIVGPDQETGHGRLNAGEVFKLIEFPKYRVEHVWFTTTPSYTLVGSQEETCLEISTVGIPLPVGIITVDRYATTVTNNHTLPTGYNLITGWPRGSQSTIYGVNSQTWANCDQDGALGDNSYFPDAGDPSLDLSALTSTSATMTGYIYELFDANGGSVGWWPFGPNDVAKFAYSLYLEDPSIQGTANLEETNEVDFQIFPNPTDGLTTLKFSESLDSNSEIVITEMTGKVVMNVLNNANTHVDSEITFSVNDLNSGIYFVTLIQTDTQLTKKLIVN